MITFWLIMSIFSTAALTVSLVDRLHDVTLSVLCAVCLVCSLSALVFHISKGDRANKELIAKCEESLPRNQNCKLVAIPKKVE